MGRRRILAIVGLLGLAAMSAAGLSGGLVAGGRPQPAVSQSSAQLVNADQAARLALARLTNFRDAQASFRAVIDAPGGDVHVTGWIDWTRPLIYLNSAAEQAGPADGLVQAVPGVVAVHAGRYPQPGSTAAATGDPYPPPPATPPADGWRVRQMNPMDPGAGGSAFDTLLALLFSLAAPTEDNSATILAGARTTVRPDQLGGTAVDVYSGPAIVTPGLPAAPLTPTRKPSTPGTPPGPPGPPATRSSSGSPPGAGPPASGALPVPSTGAAAAMPPINGDVQYWLDGTGRIRRVVTNLASQLPVQVDLTRATGQRLPTVPMLGGAAVAPRPLTDEELRLLSRMRLRDRDSGGGAVTLTLPINPAGLTTATGWLDWRAAAGYLSVQNPDDPGQNQLARVERTGLVSHGGVNATDPPLKPVPDGWHFSSWSSRGDAGGASDLDILLTQAVTVTSTRVDPVEDLRDNASFLRADSLGGVPVMVVEVRQASEAGVAPGDGRLRYWLDSTGLLRRIELRTRLGGFGWLDITPAPVPALPDPHTS